jgi:hypothetical protein
MTTISETTTEFFLSFGLVELKECNRKPYRQETTVLVFGF